MLNVIDTGVHTHSVTGETLNGRNVPQPVVASCKRITVTLVAPYDYDALKAELLDVCEQSAFVLVHLVPSPEGLLGHWCATFQLRARHGVVGNAQIYALLRFLSGELNWLAVKKEPVREIPPELKEMVGEGEPIAA